jgi:hypothetical protein
VKTPEWLRPSKPPVQLPFGYFYSHRSAMELFQYSLQFDKVTVGLGLAASFAMTFISRTLSLGTLPQIS